MNKITFTPCTCPLEVKMRGDEHVPTCKLFVPLWVRRNKEQTKLHGRVAVVDKTSR